MTKIDFYDISNLVSNIEIKAKLHNFQEAKTIAERLSNTPCQVLYQEDTFFNSSTGKLKLRVFNEAEGELIFYERDDTRTTKQSFYILSKTQNPGSLKLALKAALGVRGIIKKTRLVYLVGQTRIHLDQVEGLGSFIELEFVMNSNQLRSEGTKEIDKIIKQFGISQKDLIAEASIDLLNNNHRSLVTGSGL